ncbi:MULTISPECIES: IclR family transcriptional regulator [Chelativorans]|uniref:Transcriptional regulator, IclR family n=1 Tax=Chelativorans sp. (strain BNC1) TaxID=266779 RepID=Q11K57_CHESB|nr:MULTISPECIES: IclR family transcriptional regulator [Chelativorans]
MAGVARVDDDTIEIDDETSQGPSYSVPPVHRAFRLLRHIAAGGRCRNAAATARELGINRTTLIRLLHTLEAEGIIESDDDGASWQLGVGMISLAADALKSRDVTRVAQPIMARLVNELHLSIHLGVLDGRDVVYLLRETPNSHLISNIREGSRLPAHATTIGRILLAYMPERQLLDLYRDADLEAHTPKTSTTLTQLIAQIAEDRKQGIAWSKGNFEPGIGSCAAAIFDHRSRPIAGINVTGPEEQFSAYSNNAQRIEGAIKAAAAEISKGLGYRG